MTNEWIARRHLRSREEHSIIGGFVITDNHNPIVLIWEGLVEEEMPMLWENWQDIQNGYQVYFTQHELQQRHERIGKWASVYTGL